MGVANSIIPQPHGVRNKTTSRAHGNSGEGKIDFGCRPPGRGLVELGLDGWVGHTEIGKDTGSSHRVEKACGMVADNEM